ncbi:MAG TPA: sigma-54 dependent transcriptional regulator [Xanthobacteraceae bacterium]|nr:sigma-54 dependent transcriptional regulator [Xanthobacteraceae bacterium]
MAGILIVDDDAGLRDGLAETLADLGHRPQLAATGNEALLHLEAHRFDAVLLDLRMPGGLDGIEVLRRIRAGTRPPPVAVLTAYASAENTIEAMRLGAFDHLTKPIGRAELKSLIERMLLGREPLPGPDDAQQPDPGTFIGASEAMRRVQKTIGLAADSDTTVLILGETGTGKELVARALHEHSRRAAKPFVAVNCAAIPAELLESELFGHVKGAFTGAGADRSGAFRDAAGGTLFLDEIGDMPLAMQAKILRVLQERVLTPVGGRPMAIDVRVAAATHHDLPGLVTSGAFREDLFYRLNVVPIVLPPVRERLADIVPLAEHFLRLSARSGMPKRLTAGAAARLLAHSWPGNVREIKNIIERANVFVRGDIIDADDLELASAAHADLQTVPAQWLECDLPTALAKLEKAMICHALAACGGNRAEAARRLNINRQLLYAKMQRYASSEKPASEIPTRAVGKADGETAAD